MTHPPSGPQTPTPPSGPKDKARTIPEVAAELGVSEDWVRKQVKARSIPFAKFGKQRGVRFFDRHIEAIKQQFEVTPKAAPVIRIRSGRRAA